MSHESVNSQQLKLAALSDALCSAMKYGDEGFAIAVRILENETGQMRLTAYHVIWQQLDETGKQKLLQYLSQR
ncbi:MAG: hypothetical protein DSM107014_12295 [Gomphosphaeria aponina SAG 52.96 = DSM 107014]|uniref:Uncharacterized protein n=1 Tax=Gomphosphaeria aponina SAG 52.96 = DSM 107014 TaxID=1521640 RepID=A0A941JQ85_9CHRO|nr:hypothetical protein [Gomphosphaeria aponina SAG 52.96 = DSM 107014]